MCKIYRPTRLHHRERKKKYIYRKMRMYLAAVVYPTAGQNLISGGIITTLTVNPPRI